MYSSSKKATQEELRRLMSMQKLKVGVAPKKIESPLASYTPSGVLKCNVCRVEVGGEALWPRHIASKEHLREVNMRKLVKKRQEITTDSISDFRHVLTKRKGLEMPSLVTKSSESPPPPKKIKGILKNAIVPPEIPVQVPEDAMVSEETLDTDSVAVKSSLHDTIPQPKVLETTDPTLKLASRIEEANKTCAKQGDILPKGFFDDPELDAKARNIEYKNPIEEEWTKFQKEIKEETDVSAQIIADDQDIATAERQIDEIDEQMQNWNRVMDLEHKVAEARKQVRTEDEEYSSPDEMEFDEFPDWRNKKAYSH